MGLATLPLQILLISIDLLITIVTFGWIQGLQKLLRGKKLRSVPVHEDIPSHRVKTGYKHHLVQSPTNGATTLYESAQAGFRQYAASPCMGTRHFLGWKIPHKVKEFAPDTVTWRSFAAVQTEADQFGAALKAAGVQAAPTTTSLQENTTNCRIAIFENTCAEWMIACLGSFSQSMTVVTVYATLGPDAVADSVNDNICSVIVCNKANVAKLVSMHEAMPSLTHIVYTNDLVPPEEVGTPPSLNNTPKHGLVIVSFDDFVASGNVKKFPPVPPTPKTTAVIMYTSGSTGKPKGVVITHAQCIAAVATFENEFVIQGGVDQYVGYLPCAHIMELMAEFCMIGLGVRIGYADPKSLSAKGSYPQGALEVFRPSIFVAVPKIWDTIKKGVLAKVALTSPVAQLLVHTAIQWRTFATETLGIDTPFFNKLVFKKLGAGVGGNLRLAVSGGGPLNGEVQQFCRTCFCPNFSQGYGLTETCAGLTVQAFDDLRPGVAGAPIGSCEVKLESTPDIGDKAGQSYLATDKFDVDGNPVFGRGEILIKGNNVTAGYYMRDDATDEVFVHENNDDSERWFHTGDIGQFMDDGSLRIVDRKKNLVKLKGGEYIALEKMEMVYGNSAFVDAVNGGICCYGDGEMDRPVALMQLNEVITMDWAKLNGYKDESYESLKSGKNEKLMKAVMTDMMKEHSKSDLSHLEKLAGVVFVNDTWTPENGCLTAANKLQRRAVIQVCEEEFHAVTPKGKF